MPLIIIIILVILMCGSGPWVGHDYGYYPMGGIGTILVVILILFLLGILR